MNCINLGTPVEEKFEAEIEFKDERRSKCLLKRSMQFLPDNYALSKTRLNDLVKKLKNNPSLAKEYQKIIDSQL